MVADKDNIATFVEVVRRNSLAAAARHLGVPKSTVSRRLARLEEQVATRLVHRDPRRIRTTTEGRVFYESVVDAVDALDTAVATLEDDVTEPRGTIRVTAPADLARLLLIPLAAEFLERHPEISLDLIFTNRFVDLVNEGIDLALRVGGVTEPDHIARKLCPSDLRLARAPGFEVAEEEVARLGLQPFVLFRGHGRTQVLRLERPGFDSVEVTVHGRIQVDDYAGLAEFVAAGHGIGLLPEMHIADGERKGRLVAVFPEWSVSSPGVQLVYSTRQLPERVRRLAEFLCASLGGKGSSSRS